MIFLVKVSLLFLILPALANASNATADTKPISDYCSAYVPIKLNKLAELCKNRVFYNENNYRNIYNDGKWKTFIDFCERDEIKYLIHKFLPPDHAKKFNERFDNIIKLQSEIFMKFECFDQSCGSSLGTRTSYYVLETVRIILHAVVEELNNRIRRERCK
ncbi:MAG: hypothetical protein HQL79_11860 [Magnetococcales bacterium]|nr:hypothetical protein [Magnetococcales bacterium]